MMLRLFMSASQGTIERQDRKGTYWWWRFNRSLQSGLLTRHLRAGSCCCAHGHAELTPSAPGGGLGPCCHIAG